MRGSMVYFDTGLLVKLYCPEPDVEMAHQLVSRLNSQIPFTDIHSLEIRNAFRLKLFRGELELSEVRTALRVLDEELAAGRLTKPEVDFHKVFLRVGNALRRSLGGNGRAESRHPACRCCFGIKSWLLRLTRFASANVGSSRRVEAFAEDLPQLRHSGTLPCATPCQIPLGMTGPGRQVHSRWTAHRPVS